jgi:hypothetical protein
MATSAGKVKATFELTPAAKHRLATLKADVRLRLGPTVKPGAVSEASIVEALIQAADVERLAQAHRAQQD